MLNREGKVVTFNFKNILIEFISLKYIRKCVVKDNPLIDANNRDKMDAC